MNLNNPSWFKYYRDDQKHLQYPDCSMFDMVKKVSESYPKETAINFYGLKTSFKTFVEKIEVCAKALVELGIEENEKVTICMPNTPQALIFFYALNRIGALPNMIHPLSSEGEIVSYLSMSKSKTILTLDQFISKINNIEDRVVLDHIVCACIKDELPFVTGIGYTFTSGKGIPTYKTEGNVIVWNDFMKLGKQSHRNINVIRKGNDPAAILYSGGTTGTTKGIVLSNLNFNALGLQTAAAGDCLKVGGKMLSIMPIFHGFGLGVCIHTALIHGACCILVPQFSIKTYPGLLKKYKPNYIAGVPTLYEALLKSEKMKGIDLSQLDGVFSGGDSLSIELKRKVDAFLKEHGSKEQVREGFGLTECVTASCLTPRSFNKEGSIGIPFPDTYYKIVAPNTHDEVEVGQEGEIVISGPTVMLGYMDNPKETNSTLQLHEDGLVWMHTGDVGMMDADGFVYFKHRLKRMIVSSGYNIYPGQLENIIDAHPSVLYSTVIGVKDSYKGQKVKAFIVLKPDVEPSEAVKESIAAHCKKNIAKYSLPYEYEFRKELPKTLVGKVAYRKLEEEEENKLNN